MSTSISFSSITDYPFSPFTKIYSADINGIFSIIQTPYAFTRYGTSSCLAQGTANYAVYNDSNGNLTEAAALPTAQGGTGVSLSPTSSQAGQTLVVAVGGGSFVLSGISTSSSNVFNYYNFG